MGLVALFVVVIEALKIACGVAVIVVIHRYARACRRLLAAGCAVLLLTLYLGPSSIALARYVRACSDNAGLEVVRTVSADSYLVHNSAVAAFSDGQELDMALRDVADGAFRFVEVAVTRSVTDTPGAPAQYRPRRLEQWRLIQHRHATGAPGVYRFYRGRIGGDSCVGEDGSSAPRVWPGVGHKLAVDECLGARHDPTAVSHHRVDISENRRGALQQAVLRISALDDGAELARMTTYRVFPDKKFIVAMALLQRPLSCPAMRFAETVYRRAPQRLVLGVNTSDPGRAR